MFQKSIVFQSGSRPFNGPNLFPWTGLFVFGLMLILFGLIIILYPEVLVLLVASVFFFFGSVCALFALSLRNAQKKQQMFFDQTP